MKKPFALRCVSHRSVSLWLAAADPDVAYNWNACPRIAWDCSVLLSSELGLTACWPAWGVYWAEKWLGVGEQLLGGWTPPGCWSPDLTNASTREGAAVAAWFAARHHTMGSNPTMQLSSSSISSVPERSCPSPHCCSLICPSRELVQIIKWPKPPVLQNKVFSFVACTSSLLEQRSTSIYKAANMHEAATEAEDHKHFSLPMSDKISLTAERCPCPFHPPPPSACLHFHTWFGICLSE